MLQEVLKKLQQDITYILSKQIIQHKLLDVLIKPKKIFIDNL